MQEFFESIVQFWTQLFTNLIFALQGSISGAEWLSQPLYSNYLLSDLLITLFSLLTLFVLFVIAYRFLQNLYLLMTNWFKFRG